MRQSPAWRPPRLCAIVVCATVAGCTAPARLTVAEAAARDWCNAVSAGQLIPVYPLTEDLQPGDVFLVGMAPDVQAARYRERGFLPLDHHLARLSDLDYRAMYAQPAGGEPVPPRVALPSYEFEVERERGLHLAVPLRGVPIGLGLLDADHATGSISIAETSTYGVEIEEAMRQVDRWATQPHVAELLSRVARAYETPVRLRVVSRVYLSRAALVTLRAGDRRAGAIGVDPAAPTAPAAFVTPVASADRAALAGLSDAFSPMADDGTDRSLRFTHASHRLITLDERFDRPLVFAYVGFDLPVGVDGRLGPPGLTYLEINQLEPPPSADGLERFAPGGSGAG